MKFDRPIAVMMAALLVAVSFVAVPLADPASGHVQTDTKPYAANCDAALVLCILTFRPLCLFDDETGICQEISNKPHFGDGPIRAGGASWDHDELVHPVDGIHPADEDGPKCVQGLAGGQACAVKSWDLKMRIQEKATQGDLFFPCVANLETSPNEGDPGDFDDPAGNWCNVPGPGVTDSTLVADLEAESGLDLDEDIIDGLENGVAACGESPWIEESLTKGLFDPTDYNDDGDQLDANDGFGYDRYPKGEPDPTQGPGDTTPPAGDVNHGVDVDGDGEDDHTDNDWIGAFMGGLPQHVFDQIFPGPPGCDLTAAGTTIGEAVVFIRG